MASLRDRVDRLRERIPRRAQAHANAAERARRDAAERGQNDALGLLIGAVFDYDSNQVKSGGSDNFTLQHMRDRLAGGTRTEQDQAFLVSLPAETLAAVGMTAERFVELIAASFDDMSHFRRNRQA